jgi:ethanolamine utilization protein EutN
MLLARVIGNTTSTVKHPSLEGWRLLVCQAYAVDGHTPDGEPLLAVDPIGARRGDQVVLSSDGQFVRELLGDDRTPVRWCVLGVKDE